MDDLTSDIEELSINYYDSPSYSGHFRRPPPGKWWWWWKTSTTKDGQNFGYYIAAGGIIICDKQYIRGELKEGIWTLVEKSRKGDDRVEFTDIGGKYDWNDGDIYATISREFREELYNTAEIPYRYIKMLCTKSMDHDICGYDTGGSEENRKIRSNNFNEVYLMRRGKYLCLIVNRNLLPAITLDPETVEKQRIAVIQSNRFCRHYYHEPRNNRKCRDEMYRTLSLKFLPYDEIVKNKSRLSYRLITILRDSILRYKIPNILDL